MGMIGYYKMADEETLEKLKCNTIDGAAFIFGEGQEGETLDIDKTWHGIHFTLTGELDGRIAGDDLSLLVLGGQPVNDIEVAYGPLMYLTVEEVKRANEAAREISEEVFIAKFSMHEMVQEGIYPVICDEDGEAFCDYLLAYFKEIKAFFKQAAAQGKCIVFCVG